MKIAIVVIVLILLVAFFVLEVISCIKTIKRKNKRAPADDSKSQKKGGEKQ